MTIRSGVDGNEKGILVTYEIGGNLKLTEALRDPLNVPLMKYLQSSIWQNYTLFQERSSGIVHVIRTQFDCNEIEFIILFSAYLQFKIIINAHTAGRAAYHGK